MRRNVDFLNYDPAIAEELRFILPGQVAAREGRSVTEGLEVSTRALVGEPSEIIAGSDLEAIVLLFGRPALLVQDGTFEIPASDVWKNRLYPNKSKIETAIRSVMRVDVRNHPSFKWLGTGWVIAPGIMVTNRHVAQEFAKNQDGTFVFRDSDFGGQYQPFGSLLQEYNRPYQEEIGIERVLYIADDGPGSPDIAILKLDREDRLAPIPLDSGFDYSDAGRFVAAIGYPAYDYRNPAYALTQVFGSVYDVKRLSPGTVSKAGDLQRFIHDCSTLGGSSGSVVIDVESGHAVGLHFGGTFQAGNHAVKPAALLEAIAKTAFTVPAPIVPPLPFDVEERAPESYADRDGYNSAFLGTEVPFPLLQDHESEAAPLIGEVREGRPPFALDYTHFSAVMNKERRVAFYTACNIDGNEWRNLPRGGRDVWSFDPRISRDYQAGPELYANNDLDRGHITRRQDPDWGTLAEARKADKDTFHFTNCSPQHKDFNQKTWLSLEEYVLSNANVEDLKVTVFTGPVFSPNDPLYRGFQIPQEFWKVVVMKVDGNLRAVGYLLSQAPLVQNLEFVYGKFRTYQIPVAGIEERTGLSFNGLAERDPFIQEGIGIRVIDSGQDVRI